MTLQLNCDLGESFGSWSMGMDAAVMPYIDQASIACGFHAGDPMVIRNTLALAKAHHVVIGAHPSYQDLVGFGRRSMQCSSEEIISLMHYQIAAMDGMAASAGLTLDYVKPHGALYNDMMAQPDVRDAIMVSLSEYHRPLTLMLQATLHNAEHQSAAERFGLDLCFEAFADRCYDDDGRLLARSKPSAIHNKEKMLAQVHQLCNEGSVTTVNGNTLKLQADTLCVHGDNKAGVQAIQEICELING